jgi:hypothetical protein
MPLYLCRWPNGDCSVVSAANKGDAIEIFDEVDNAEGCPLTPLPDFMVHFPLSDEGTIEFEGFCEATGDAIFRLAYPVLDETEGRSSGTPLPSSAPAFPAISAFPHKIKDL